LTELAFDQREQHSKFWIRMNFRLNHHFLPRRSKHSSLAVKREHDDIRLAPADW